MLWPCRAGGITVSNHTPRRIMIRTFNAKDMVRVVAAEVHMIAPGQLNLRIDAPANPGSPSIWVEVVGMRSKPVLHARGSRLDITSVSPLFDIVLKE